MIKKFVRLYGEAVQLAVRYPQFIILFFFSNLLNFLDYYYLSDSWQGVLFPIALIVRLGALGGIGYVIIHLLRRDKPPQHIFTRGIKQNFWKMLKYMILQLVIFTLTTYLPIALLERYIIFPPFTEYFWLWINEYLFIFLILESIFWEDVQVRKAYRLRNIFMLARFEWMLPVYIIVKLPFLIVNLLKLRGHQLIFSGFWFVMPLLIIIVWDWINTIFSFKVFGAERLAAVQEVETKLKTSTKKMKEKINQRRKDRS